MKKLLKFLPLVVVALMAVTFWSCSDDDDFKPVTNTELPTAAKTFLETYYPSENYQAKKDKNEFEVYLSNGQKVEFYKDGEWKNVDAVKRGETVPTGFYPSEIDTYVGENHAGEGVHEISKESYGYDVELTNNVDIEFNTNGEFIRYDR